MFGRRSPSSARQAVERGALGPDGAQLALHERERRLVGDREPLAHAHGLAEHRASALGQLLVGEAQRERKVGARDRGVALDEQPGEFYLAA